MDHKTTLEIFKTQIKKKKNFDKAIGNVLMNQKVISGIGNYLRSEILYVSKINPFRIVKNISDNELKEIFNNSKILTWGDFNMKQLWQSQSSLRGKIIFSLKVD
jgi:formamidopyrimidine-DNA glycosylase